MIINDYLQEIIAGESEIRSLFEWGARLRKEGKNPIDLSIGNPDIKPPEEYYRALEKILSESRASSSNLHRYMPNSGYFETKNSLALGLSQWLNLKIKPERVFITAGAANGLDVLLKTIIEPAVTYYRDTPQIRKGAAAKHEILKLDEVITIAPYFMEYSNYIKNNQGKQIVVHSGKHFQLDISQIEKAISNKTKAIILNFPNNPAGTLYSKDDLVSLAELLKSKNKEFGISITVIEDSSYGQILFGEKKLDSILPFYRYSFYVSSFSKSLGLAGERIGYFAAHPDIEDCDDDWGVLHQALTINLRTRIVNAPALQQRVIEKIGAFTKVNVREYEWRINELAAALKSLGFKFEKPEGGFYIFAQIPDQFKDANHFKQAAHHGDEPLLFIPGTAFGGSKYKRYIRLSACVSNGEINRACRRLKEICKQ